MDDFLVPLIILAIYAAMIGLSALTSKLLWWRIYDSRYAVQYTVSSDDRWSGIGVESRDKERAIQRCIRTSEATQWIRYRVFDKRTRKVVYEHGKHRRAPANYRSDSGRRTCCPSCGTPGDPFTGATSACCTYTRTGQRTRSGLMANVLWRRVVSKLWWRRSKDNRKLLYLYDSPLLDWTLAGMTCGCVHATIRIRRAWYSVMPDQHYVVADVECAHASLTDIILTICKQHLTLNFDRNPKCCYGRFPGQPQIRGALRGFRLFRVKKNKLRSFVTDYVYHPGLNVCPNYERGMRAYRFDNGGFYLFDTVEEIKRQEAGAYHAQREGEFIADTDYFAIGSMLCFGEIKEGERGWRAEKVIPEYLFLANEEAIDYNLMLFSIAEHYRMKLVTLEDARDLPNITNFTQAQLREIQGWSEE